MTSFSACRGTVFAFPSGGGEGFFKLSGLRGSADSPVFINGAEISDVDAVSPVLTLGRNKILYSFGEDFGSAVIQGVILLGASGGSGLGAVIEFFKSKRTSATDTPVQFSTAGGGGYNIFLTGLTISPADPRLHIQPFGLVGLIAEPG